MNCLCSLSKKWIYQKTMSINQQSNHIATILTNTRSIIKESMLIATDFLLVGFPSLKTFTLRSIPLTCHSARNRRRNRRIRQHRGIKDYLDLPFRKKTRLRISITPLQIDKIFERTVLLKILVIFQNLGSHRFSRGAA